MLGKHRVSSALTSTTTVLPIASSTSTVVDDF